MSRVASYGTDHVLVAVPEEEASMLEAHSNDKDALLGVDRGYSDRPAKMLSVPL